jgi:uncharacterized protein (DUF305 family)
MATLSRTAMAAGLCAAVFGTAFSAGCKTTPGPGASPPRVSPAAPAAPATPAAAQTPLPPGLHATPPGLGRYPYSDADIEFMSGMIPHHAQAVIMAGWCASHGARADVTVLCGRIVVAQKDEIAMMQQWLSDRGLPVPDATSTHHMMKMEGMDMEHDTLMPGMLTDEQMKQLDQSRGAEFDRLFLVGMMRHHQGAIDMVDKLFKSFGAAQDETVFKFANDVQADQAVEIDRMKQMLEEGGNSK